MNLGMLVEMLHFIFVQVAIACDGSVLCNEEMYISQWGDFSFYALTSMVPPKGGEDVLLPFLTLAVMVIPNCSEI
jgi:hypothetical protein